MPTLFDFRDHLPLTTSGKVDRQGLTRSKDRPRLDNEYRPPRDDLEIYLTNTWQRVIGVEPVGIHDRFFDLGGDSLRAIEFHRELESKLEVPVSATALFEAPTIAHLSEFLQGSYPEATGRVFGVTDRSGPDRARPSRRQQPNRRQVSLRAGHRRGRGET